MVSVMVDEPGLKAVPWKRVYMVMVVRVGKITH